MTRDIHATVADALGTIDSRYSAGRRALVEVLASAHRPMSLPQILAADASIAQSSAYRNLGILERAGVVHRITGATDEFSRFELANDLTEHHHHLICHHCGGVEDFKVSDTVEAAVDKALNRVARRHGFRPEHHRLDLVGTCSTCAAHS